MPGVAEIDDFFGVEDPWLAGYFQMLTSELEVLKPLDRKVDPLLLDQSEHLLIRHLLRWYRRGVAREPRAPAVQPRANPLRPALMRRAEEYIQANLAGEISLASLARSLLHVGRPLPALVPRRVRVDAVPVRSERRLRKASTMLKTGDTPIAAIAVQCGFGNPSTSRSSSTRISA